MNREDIIRMAREHHMQALPLDCYAGHIVNLESLVKAAFDAGAAAEREKILVEGWRQCSVGQRTTQFCELIEQAIVAEREQCAKVADGFIGADPIAVAIRARGNQ